MTPQEYSDFKAIFHVAADLAPQFRAAYLDQACANAPELRRELESLLAANDQPTGILGTPAEEFVPELQIPEPHAGEAVGRYRLVRQIGAGGMGFVWEAERADEQYRQRVAIKLLKPGLDKDAILRRFQYERQIMAGLNHPNIARLYDGGITAKGQPYFVMEYVVGVPIDEYCKRQKLDLESLLRLFREVCAAVQHAHQHLVIHRDLKPSNILVTEDGAVKLLDFGIAKLVDVSADDLPSNDLTRTGVRVMTPQYASPEQIACKPVSTASDVYSLGLILYELVTGQSPYGASVPSLAQLERLVLEAQPRRPSTLFVADSSSQPWLGRGGRIRRRSRLSADMDNIILMAIRKEPERRYGTAEELSEDIRRYLERLPVRAHRDSFQYRAEKFIQRNKSGVAAAVLIAIVLAGGAASTAYQARIAERNFNDVRTLANTFLFEFEEAVVPLPGWTPVRKMVVSRALQFLERLSRETRRDASLRRELATAYRKIADIQGNPFAANLGDIKGGLSSYQKALDLLPAGQSESEQDRFDLLQRIAQLHMLLGDTKRGLQSFEELLPLLEKWAEADPGSVARQRALEVNLTRLGDALMLTGDSSGALDRYRAALSIAKNLASKPPADVQAMKELALCLSKVGDAEARLGRLKDALESQRASLKLSNQLAVDAQENVPIRRDIRITRSKLAALLSRLGNTKEAIEEAQTALDIAADLEKSDPQNATAARDLSIAHITVGDLLLDDNQPDRAGLHYAAALSIRRTLSDKDPENRLAVRDLGVALSRMVELQRARRRFQDALRSAGEVASISERLAKLDAANTLLQSDLASDLETLAGLQLDVGNAGAGLFQLQRATEIRERLSKQDSENAELQGDLALTYIKKGDVARKLRRSADAARDYNAGMTVLLELKSRDALSSAYKAALTEVSTKLRRLP